MCHHQFYWISEIRPCKSWWKIHHQVRIACDAELVALCQPGEWLQNLDLRGLAGGYVNKAVSQLQDAFSNALVNIEKKDNLIEQLSTGANQKAKFCSSFWLSCLPRKNRC